ncbi:MAG TPA: FxLYD domain-containing protein [Dehalococcoidia bacterium]|nr:FxLYD domain-containing protein [Dehalococcoidia bacterium]
MKIRRPNQYFLLITVVLIVLLVPFAITTCAKADVEVQSGQVQILRHSMTVQNFSKDQPTSVAVVSGTATNTGSQTIDMAVISVVFRDNTGKAITTGTATRQNLQAGETWDFSIQSWGTEAWKIHSYDIRAE